MKTKIINIALAALAALGFASCTLHQEPELTPGGERGEDPTQVMVNAQLNLNVELPGTDRTLFEIPDTVMHRFIIETYDRYRSMVNRQVMYDRNLTATRYKLPVSLKLHAAAYRIVVWSDYVRVSDPEAQLFYNAETLIPVINNGGYRGNNNAKDAFSGSVDIDLSRYADDWNANVDVDVELTRPVGRYELLSTDAGAFYRRLKEGAIKGERFTARIKYAGYLAVGYNCYDCVRKHSLNYMAYNTTFRVKEGDINIPIGFDYIFVAPDETLEVPVEVEIVNENSETLSRAQTVITISRNMNTIVRGRFLTSTAEGGMNVNTDFDGTITVDLGTLTPTR